MMSEIAPQSQSRLSAELGPPQDDCTASVSAGHLLMNRVMASSSFCCCSEDGDDDDVAAVDVEAIISFLSFSLFVFSLKKRKALPKMETRVIASFDVRCYFCPGCHDEWA